MAIPSVESFLAALATNGLLPPARLDEARQLARRFAEPRDLARELLQRGWLTAYQTNQVLLGRADSLRLGQYVLLERLGHGGMGQVFKARHLRLERIVALKLILPERLQTSDAVRRFRQEAKAAARLSHPNIVLVHDADEVHGTHFLVMEYVEGKTLDRFVTERGPLAITAAAALAQQAAQALQHAFERGVVHRDVKPANLIVQGGASATVKLLDLGLARLGEVPGDAGASSPVTRIGAAMGTPDYMAPEQAVDARRADTRADVYSLGCTLYFMLTGEAPFPSGSPQQKLLWHHAAEPPRLAQLRRELPAGFAAVLVKALAKQPADRYQTPGEFAEALRVAGESAVVAAPAPVPDPVPLLVAPTLVRSLPRGPLRRAWPALAAVAAVLLLVVLWSVRRPGTGPADSPRAKVLPPPPTSKAVEAKQPRDEEVRRAVVRGLDWLALHQGDNGAWSFTQFQKAARRRKEDPVVFTCDCSGPGSNPDWVAATGLVVLAYLAAGEKSGIDPRGGVVPAYGTTVERGLKFLLSSQQANGSFVGNQSYYGHAIAMLALCEAYAAGDIALREPAFRALGHVLRGQHAGGSWGYLPFQQGDTSITMWQLAALVSARRAGLEVPTEAQERAGSFLDGVVDGKGRYGYRHAGDASSAVASMTVDGVLCRLYLGWPSSDPRLKASLDRMEDLPAVGPTGLSPYHDFHRGLVHHLHGGAAWRKWWSEARAVLLERQDVGEGHQRGSWEPSKQTHNVVGGRVITTAFHLLILQFAEERLLLFRRAPW